MIFVDSNIPMCLVGAVNPNKKIARRLLDKCITRGGRLVADTEVLQEILHRYVAINRRDTTQPAFDALLAKEPLTFIALVSAEAATKIYHLYACT